MPMFINNGFTAYEIGKRVRYSAEKITLRYAYLFPSKQNAMAEFLDQERDMDRLPEEEKRMSAKSRDEQGRRRNKVIAFRVSPEADERIESAGRISRLTKQDYITRRRMDLSVEVQGNREYIGD